MRNLTKFIALVILLLVAASGSAQVDTPASNDDPQAAPAKFFEDQVLPILQKRCWECHGAEVQESGLRLDSRQHLMAGGSSGEVIAVSGRPDESFLIDVVQYTGDVQMPPDEKLPDPQIATLRRWIASGIPWPADVGTGKPLTREEQYAQQLEQHWSFQPLVAPDLPEVQNRAWVADPLDQFVLAQLERNGLTPSPRTDRYTLVRRLKFDLLGLPPTCDEVQAFITDDDPDAYEKLVDRYLASPRYGERWGRHWLDVARYADTKGYAFNRDRRYPFAYTYRDYVIQALNDDLPFDQFVMEQLAADLIVEQPHDLSLAALGFLTVGRKFNRRHLDIDDQIDVVGRGLLGLTVTCARCHDHKYDPIPTEDYYSLYGVFASSAEPGELPTIGDPTATPGYAAYKQELDSRRATLDAYTAQLRDEIVESARQHATDYLARAILREPEESMQKNSFIELKGEQVRQGLVHRWRSRLATIAKPDHPVLGPLFELALLPDAQYAAEAPAILTKWSQVKAGRERGKLNALVKEALAQAPPGTKLDLAHLYGELFSKAYAQQQQINSASKSASAAHSAEVVTVESLDPDSQQLLDILVGPDSLTDLSLDDTVGLLTRAERNKYQELKRKIDAFQVESAGSPPRAMVLRENPTPDDPHVFVRGNPARPGKAVPRQFLLAVAGENRRPFQHSSGRLELAQAIVAPSNPLTARVVVNRVWMHHFSAPLVNTPSDFGTRCERPVQADLLDHLAAQLIKDQWSLKRLHRHIVLSSTYRQASLRREECEAADPENQLYWRANRRRLEFEAMRDALLAVSDQLDLTMGGRPVKLTERPFPKRRAVYGYIDRQDLPGLYRVFDFAGPDQSCPRRSRTTVPQQALFLLNSPFVIECAAQVVASPRFMSAEGTAARIETLYQTVLSRAPTGREQEIGEEFLAQSSEVETGNDKSDIWQQYAQLLMVSNAFMFVD